MHVIGVVEVAAGLMVAVAPRFGAPLVAAWLGGIVFNLLTYSGYYDIAAARLWPTWSARWRSGGWPLGSQGTESRIACRVVSKRTTLGDRISLCIWPNPDAERIVVLVHGYGEHIGRYDHVAEALVERGAIVVGPDHIGHGESEGERVLIEDFEQLVDDVHTVVEGTRKQHPGLPVVMVGHSMGGLVAARYAQRHGDELAGLVLSAPSIGLAAGARAGAGAAARGNGAARRSDRPDGALARPLGRRGVRERPARLARRLEARRRSRRSIAANEAVDAGPTFGELPVLYVHGEVDQLVPLALARPAVERLRGSDFSERIVPEARHEVFNELEQDETIGLVADFAERVTGN